MSRLSDIKLNKLNSLNNQGGFWYITKQNLVFRDLCFMAKILDAWNDSQVENFASFFDSHKCLPEYGELAALTPHRATKNCEYLGLTVPSERYSAQNLTPFYFALKDLCKGDFNRLSLYPDIINKQLERIFIDSSLNALYTSQIKICPFMFLFKILLLIGDITSSYKISIQEFKLFVATAQTWNDYFEVVESILRYRSDVNYKNHCDANLPKVADERYHILTQNHSQLEVTGTEISIKEGNVKSIRRKVSEYELNDALQSAEDIFSADFVSSNLQHIEQSYQPILTALRTKPFVLLAGISGTGKSRIVRELAFKSCPEELRDADGTTPGNYRMIEVKPNWHDSTELLGYYSNIGERYVFTDFVKFLVKAMQYPKVPFFVCLDEMNLAPVEQYFAEFLSVVETRKMVDGHIVTGALVKPEWFTKKYKGGFDPFVEVGLTKVPPTTSEGERNIAKQQTEVSDEQYVRQDIVDYLKEKGLTLPDNVFIVGTVNMDDTTHQFSRKVIDRAMTIEMNGGDLNAMFGGSAALEYLPEGDVWKIGLFRPRYVNADEVLAVHSDCAEQIRKQTVEKIEKINNELANTPFVVSYRVLNELVIYLGNLLDDAEYHDNGADEAFAEKVQQAFDAITLMKILPRVEGDDEMFSLKNDTETRLQKIQALFNADGDTSRKLKEMNDRLEQMQFTRFWP